MEELQKIVLSASMTMLTVFLGMAVKSVKEYLIKKGEKKQSRLLKLWQKMQ